MGEGTWATFFNDLVLRRVWYIVGRKNVLNIWAHLFVFVSLRLNR